MDNRLAAQKDKERLLATMKDIVSDVKEMADYAESNDGDIAELQAYVNVLHTIWRNCAEEDREAIGIDFDISEKYGISSFIELL